LRFTTVLNIGIGIIVPASVETTDLALNLEHSPDVAARVLEPGWKSATVSKWKLSAYLPLSVFEVDCQHIFQRNHQAVQPG